MSETSETMGRCRAEMDDCHGSNTMLVLADALDRLAADVAEVKEATLPKTTSVRCNFACPFMEERDAAVRERDEAIRERDEARAKVEQLSRAVRLANNAVDGMKAELAARPAAAGWLTEPERELLALVKDMGDCYSGSDRRCGWRCNWPYDRVSSVAAALLARAGSPQPANSSKISNGSTAAGWLTADEAGLLRALLLFQWKDAKPREAAMGLIDIDRVEPILRSLLARAGSTPVVEVPAMCPSAHGYDSPFHDANYRAAHSRACAAHRAALDKAGIQWKAVPRE